MKNLWLPLFALLPFLAGCASFAHGIANEREAVLASWDDIQTRADAAGGQLGGIAVAPVHAVGRFFIVVGLAGLSGVAHAPSDALSIVGVKCAECEAGHAITAVPASRPAPR